MSISINTESAELGNFGPFALSYNSKKDRLYAKADDVSMYCNPSDAPRHRESFPALTEAFSRLVSKEMHELLCHCEPADDATPDMPEMPEELRELFEGLDRLVTEIPVPKDTPESQLPGRPVSEAPEGLKRMLEGLAKELGIDVENIRFAGGPTPDSNE